MSERDFYFGKLQEVERVCQELSQRKDNHPETELVLAQINQVLYKGFDSPGGSAAPPPPIAAPRSISPISSLVISGSPLVACSEKAMKTPSPGTAVSARIIR